MTWFTNIRRKLDAEMDRLWSQTEQGRLGVSFKSFGLWRRLIEVHNATKPWRYGGKGAA